MIRMKFQHILLVLLLPLMLLCTSCNDKINLMADYKDIRISYAVLNVNDPIHYFKIYRGYQTEENAYVEASNWDQIYYPVDSIEVRLEEYAANGTKIRDAVLDTTTSITRAPGYFANPKQMLYYSTWQLDEECKYRLVIKHVNSGEEVYAETLIVGNCVFSKPYNQNPFNCSNDHAPLFQIVSEDGSLRDKNVAVADMYLIFHYLEIDNQTKAVSHKTISKKMNASFLTPQSDGSITFDGFYAKDLMLAIKENVKPNDNVTRYLDTVDGKPFFCLEIQAWLATKDYQIYHNVAAPTTSLVQDRLEYTNFISPDNNAFGLFASRNSCKRSYKFDNTEGKYNEDSLVKGSITKGLNFDYYRNSPEFFEVTTK